MSVHNSIGLKLRRAYMHFHRRAHATLSEHKITADQFAMLSLLAEQDGVTQRNLVDALGSDSSTVAAMAKLLLERGAIRKEPSTTDRRAVLVFLTENGRELHDFLAPLVQPIRDELDAAIPDSLLEHLGDALDEIANRMKS